VSVTRARARRRRHQAGVADLAAGLAVERRLVDDDRAALAGLSASTSAVAQQRLHDAFGLLGVVAEELGGADLLAQREPDGLGRRLARARPGRARLSRWRSIAR
jgi:hypothetical protein